MSLYKQMQHQMENTLEEMRRLQDKQTKTQATMVRKQLMNLTKTAKDLRAHILRETKAIPKAVKPPKRVPAKKLKTPKAPKRVASKKLKTPKKSARDVMQDLVDDAN